MVERLFDTISDRIEDVTNGGIPGHRTKVFFKGLIFTAPLLITVFIVQPYWYRDGWLRFNGYVVLAYVLSILACGVVFLIAGHFRFAFQPWNWKILSIIIVVIIVLLLGIKPLARHKDTKHSSEVYKIQEEQKDARRIKNPQAIFGEIERTSATFRNRIMNEFIGKPVEFAVTFVNVDQAPVTFQERVARRQGMPIKDSYYIELVSDESGTKTAITCFSTLEENPRLIELKGGERLKVKGNIINIDLTDKSILISDPKLIFPENN